ncbi:heat induced stress protein yflt [Lucifera butyrica]|uniref:Heat induced stress protein yflt n=1 Tax=Lucifera butyrica TaxID=1351585 RepID=A0A498RAM8_9FIRM|nr:general stress protein [Lucifera butyrica]VBB08035.1 heat induced stress protein yflt [Lucifera butyrica]
MTENTNQTPMQSGTVTTSYTNAEYGANQMGTPQRVTSGQVKAVIGVFSTRDQAEKAVEELRRQGFSTEEINILSKDRRGQGGDVQDDDITDGAMTGGTIGGIGGLLLGAGALAIPGIGPVIAAGPIAAALSGAVAGGLAGGLIDWGIPAEASEHYEQEVARGGILAVIRTQSTKVNQAAQILRQNGAQDVESHNAR